MLFECQFAQGRPKKVWIIVMDPERQAPLYSWEHFRLLMVEKVALSIWCAELVLLTTKQSSQDSVDLLLSSFFHHWKFALNQLVDVPRPHKPLHTTWVEATSRSWKPLVRRRLNQLPNPLLTPFSCWFPSQSANNQPSRSHAKGSLCSFDFNLDTDLQVQWL